MDTQWVNLTQDNRLLEPGEARVDLGPRVRIRMKTTKPNTRLRYTFEPDGGNAKYTPDELGRKPEFRADPGPGVATTDANGEFVVDVRLPLAGGDKFKLKAKAGTFSKTLASDTIETARRIFYQSVPMEGVAPPDLGPVVQYFWDAARIQLVEKDPGMTIEAAEVWRSGESSGQAHTVALEMNAKAAEMADFAPHDFTVFWAKHFGTQSARLIRKPTDVAEGAAGDVQVEFPYEFYLWHGPGLDDGDDDWLSSLSGTFQPDGVQVASPLALTRDMAHIQGDDDAGYRAVHVRVPAALLGAINGSTKGVLMLALSVCWVQPSNQLGSAYENTIVISTKELWHRQIPEAQLLYVLVHELGHRLGMATQGGQGTYFRADEFVDAPPKFYTGNGHQGPHCGAGARYDPHAAEVTRRWSGTPGCVMFGCNAVWSGNGLVYPPTTFCSDCAKRAKKLSLGG